MTIQTRISAAELTAQVTNNFVNEYFEVALCNAPGVVYTPGLSTDSTFIATEIQAGYGGYRRQVITFNSGDVTAYADDGVALSPKVAIFEHDGNNAEAISFTHVVLMRGNGQVLAVNAVTQEPTIGAADGFYPDVPVNTGNGSTGYGMTVDLTVSGSVHTVTVNAVGYGYTVGESVEITQDVLASIGANSGYNGSVIFTVSDVHSSSGGFVSVAAPDTSVLLQSGNQAAFYYNVKQFGYYNV